MSDESSMRAALKSITTNAGLLRSGAWALSLALRSQRWLLVGRLAVAIAAGVVPAGLALVMRGLVNAVVEASKSSGPDASLVMPWLASGFALTIFDVLSKVYDRYAASRLEDELELDVTSRIMEHAAKLDVSFFETTRFQDTLERARQNTNYHLLNLLTSVFNFVTNSIQIVTLTGIMFMLEPLALLALLPFALVHFVFQWVVSKKHYEDERSRATKRRWTRYFLTLVTTRDSVPEVKLLDLGPVLTERYRRFMTEFRDHNRARHWSSFVGGAVFAVLTVVAVYYMFDKVVTRVLLGQLSVGDIAVFGVAALRLRNALETVVMSSTRGMTHALYITNLREFLDVTPVINRCEGRVTGISQGVIELDHVTFSYPGAATPTIHDVTLRIEPGEVVALVGRNGAGKSTLVRLVARFYDPDSGRITVDGIDLRELSQRYLHERVGFVFQQPGRYEATARENIAFGKWRDLLDTGADVRAIAQRANVAKFLEVLPKGYETTLGREFGEVDLSIGQWQQLAIARALARDAAFLVLDEPAASLDAEAEYELFCSSRRLAAGRTTILISHRFSTVSMADRIIVMDHGRIVEVGTHAELMAIGGYYANLYNLQQQQMTMGITDDADDDLALGGIAPGRVN